MSEEIHTAIWSTEISKTGACTITPLTGFQVYLLHISHDYCWQQ